mmetsp:Transcript_20325/g.26340  ORF Transcript_20325/g.26340 Transcript_20325/m.26340 type:complete len:271 (-) Transcript_20325:189-1001(-)
MFVLSTVRDTIRVHPSQFSRDLDDSLRDVIDAKYGGRVLEEIGLCMCVVSLVEIETGIVHPQDGCASYQVEFQLLVWRPFAGEIIQGRLIGSHHAGLRVSLDFFEDIIIPLENLPSPNTYDPETRLWTWHYDDSEFHLDPGLEVRFQVKAITFTQVSAQKRGLQATTTSIEKASGVKQAPTHTGVRRRSSSIDLDSSAPIPSAMQVFGSINADGLGPTGWWEEEENDSAQSSHNPQGEGAALHGSGDDAQYDNGENGNDDIMDLEDEAFQ